MLQPPRAASLIFDGAVAVLPTSPTAWCKQHEMEITVRSSQPARLRSPRPDSMRQEEGLQSLRSELIRGQACRDNCLSCCFTMAHSSIG